MGVIAVAAVLMVKFAALASVRAERFWIAAALCPLAGRCAIVVQMAMLRYARPEGLGKVFCRRRAAFPAVLAGVVLAGPCAAAFGWAGLALAGACLAGAALLAAYFHRKIGGATGDTFGAACELVELVPAVMLAAWPLEPARWLT
jgi:adenosylcobinamide-GDP ribazoletransferase